MEKTLFVTCVRSIRTLLTKPGFTVVVVLMLSVGIATNTAIFSVVFSPATYGPDPLRS
jgi:hypothetical protein